MRGQVPDVRNTIPPAAAAADTAAWTPGPGCGRSAVPRLQLSTYPPGRPAAHPTLQGGHARQPLGDRLVPSPRSAPAMDLDDGGGRGPDGQADSGARTGGQGTPCALPGGVATDLGAAERDTAPPGVSLAGRRRGS